MPDTEYTEARAALMVTIGILAAFDDDTVETIGLSQDAIKLAQRNVWTAIHCFDALLEEPRHA